MQIKIDRCLDAGGSWNQAQDECVYVDRESILFYVEQYDENILDAEQLLSKVTIVLEKQFKMEASEASLILQASNILGSADTLYPEILENVKVLLSEKTE
jgi:regulator of sigma D